MVVKAFNVDEKTYKKFSSFCKQQGISMSKQVNFFMQSFIEPTAKREYLEKLDRLRKQPGIYVGSIDDFKKKYNL